MVSNALKRITIQTSSLNVSAQLLKKLMGVHDIWSTSACITVLPKVALNGPF
jgi:hypothetical protein